MGLFESLRWKKIIDEHHLCLERPVPYQAICVPGFKTFEQTNPHYITLGLSVELEFARHESQKSGGLKLLAMYINEQYKDTRNNPTKRHIDFRYRLGDPNIGHEDFYSTACEPFPESAAASSSKAHRRIRSMRDDEIDGMIATFDAIPISKMQWWWLLHSTKAHTREDLLYYAHMVKECGL